MLLSSKIHEPVSAVIDWRQYYDVKVKKIYWNILYSTEQMVPLMIIFGLTFICILWILVLDAAHHRHWPGVLKIISGCHISLFQIPLPEDTVQLGGSMSLHGNHMTLACFHGPNFRSKSWALFHLEEPNIAFWTEAQKIWEEGKYSLTFLNKKHTVNHCIGNPSEVISSLTLPLGLVSFPDLFVLN